jgi:hypothetical protein
MDEEEKYPELSVKMFFDFMKTAYQVNENFEKLASTLSANSEIDWTALTKVSLNLEETECKTKSENATKNHKKLQTIFQKVILLIYYFLNFYFCFYINLNFY